MRQKKNSVIKILIAIFLIGSFSCRKSDYNIEATKVIRDNGSGTGTVTWTNDHEYILDGIVFVNQGQTLTIEPGTVIKGKTGQADNASALIVARGAKIIAKGTIDQPIIFTSENDDLQGSIHDQAKGLWGGLIILGYAPINNERGENYIEGISITEPRGVYGGKKENDNSGVLQYISIRHGGTSLSENNEINGITLGGVGNETVIDHIEVISNADDGFEFFGGTVNCSYLVSAWCEDDAFDFDEGYKGSCQFLFGLKEQGKGDRLLEISDSQTPSSLDDATDPVIYNASFYGDNSLSYMASFQNNAAGVLSKSVFVNQKNGIDLEWNAQPVNSYKQFENGNIIISHNIFYNVEENIQDSILKVRSILDVTEKEKILDAYFHSAGNVIRNIGISESKPFNIKPASGISNDTTAYLNNFFDEVGFTGAFNDINWMADWTLITETNALKNK
jgi:hypothetical protein